MEHAEQWLTAVKLVGGAIAALLIGLAGVFTGRKANSGVTPSTSAEGDVVAATFTERALMENLTVAMNETTRAVLASTAETTELVTLLRADAQRRHDEAVIREALRKRGIME